MDYSSIFSAIAAVAAAVSALVSLCQVLQAKRTESNIRKINNDTLWYNRIVLDTVIMQLNSTIDRIERKINECKSSGEVSLDKLETVNQTINADINSMSELLFLLKIFDKNLFDECSKKLEAIRDIYSDVINRSIKVKQISFYSVHRVHAKKKDIVELLLEYAKKITN